jgi:cytochrome c
MDSRTNTTAGWTLGACAAALALTIAGSTLFTAEKPEKAGYPVEGVAAGAAGGGEAEVPIADLLAKADAAHGAEVFKKCAACHTINQGGANGIGPNLYATVGEAKGEGKAGFAFSDALKGKGGTWDFESLNAWLASPRKFVPGTKMTFAGLSAGKDRADVILYLNQQGSNLPLPAPKAGAPTATDAKAPPGAAPATPGDKAKPSVEGLSNVATPANVQAPVEK